MRTTGLKGGLSVLLAAFLAACSQTTWYEGLEPQKNAIFGYAGPAQGGLETTQRAVATEDAWARLPTAAGRVIAVTERRRPQAVTQRIVLSGSGDHRGENVIDVSVAGPEGADTALLRPPSLETIQAEIGGFADGRAFQIVDAETRNAYGPFGYAVARSGNTNCVYAWQWLDTRTLAETPRAFDPRIRPLSLRIRLCDEQPTARLVAVLRSLDLPFADRRDGSPDDAAGGRFASGADALAIANARLGVATTPASPQPVTPPTGAPPQPKPIQTAKARRTATIVPSPEESLNGRVSAESSINSATPRIPMPALPSAGN
ncbi:cellulose biosynthesis protein BcsN [Jiella sp. MQZ9-1]|uniref:Cellulose biosynthesis protein BcsN n=1 Tax=Jiella flava TaxID=2816857 RepID=A0A939FWH7_9HYPH|nr:cellulose biosynthesis protein BcsN [Jiella flava]MBO0662139.1 cellulose biosynthesis protein BcsN [Jiella flava]MCD2470532.1 cellulose biosynthesis protein BcsN [Jiella flava]